MSLCNQCPIGKQRKHLKECSTRCDNEYEQMSKITEAEALFNDLDKLYEKIMSDAKVIDQIEEEYETDAISTSECW